MPNALPFIAHGLYLCDDASIIGQRFQIIEYRPGLVIREHLPAELAHRPEIGVRLSQVLLETIAAIHAVDTKAVGLDDLGRPDGFLARGVSGWRKRGLTAMEPGTETLHIDVGKWLEQNLVPDGPPGLLHNDFKLNNMILDPDNLSPRAVVDWDQGTRGDPLFDFATLLSYWIHADDPWAMHDMEQMPALEACLCTRQEAVATYARLSGRDMSNFLFHRVLAMYKFLSFFCSLACGIAPARRKRRGTLRWLGSARAFWNSLTKSLRAALFNLVIAGCVPASEDRRWTFPFLLNCRSCSSALGLSSATRSSRWRATAARRITVLRRNFVANWWRWRQPKVWWRRMSGWNTAGWVVACREGGGFRGGWVFAARAGGDAYLRA